MLSNDWRLRWIRSYGWCRAGCTIATAELRSVVCIIGKNNCPLIALLNPDLISILLSYPVFAIDPIHGTTRQSERSLSS